MNQEKIGKFIADARKNKNMTQQELADKIGVTDRAISNWENGRRLPDYSLLKDLSEKLGVSINEILAGEKIEEKDIMKKSDENIIKLTELISFKSMRYGIIGMALVFILLVLISTAKEINPAPLVSLLCTYNAVTFLSRYKFEKDKCYLVGGSMFALAAICNTIAFILN